MDNSKDDASAKTDVSVQIKALQKKIDELSNNSSGNKASQITELQKKIDELSAKTIDGSVFLTCGCHHSPSFASSYQPVIGAGNSKAEAKKDAEEACTRMWKDREINEVPSTPFVANCVVNSEE